MDDESEFIATRGTFEVFIEKGEAMTCSEISLSLAGEKQGCCCCNPSGTRSAAYVGKMELLPYRADELPEFWYFCNGDNFPLTSPQGKALASLSATMKEDWGIVATEAEICLPNMFQGEDGYFLRAVDGESRQAGETQSDAIRNITGSFTGETARYVGAFAKGGTISSTLVGTGGQVDSLIRFAPSNQVPAAHEFRPMNVGMTPAIYLGA